MGLAQRDTEHYTVGDYLTWPEDVRYELIDGIAYMMAPAPTVFHQDIAGEIYFQLRQKLEDHPCRVLIAPVDVVLPRQNETDEQANTIVQPDVLVVCDPDKILEKRVRGAPDFIVEVLSPATASHDMVIKRQLYEKSGVREYWLIHPTDRVLITYRLEGLEFGKPDMLELKGETPVAVLPGVVIQWDALVSRLPKPD
ncbi:MAG: Uma2 family endonuclease [Sulfuricellaceae bacterium]|nr:Uma2 family endonuclease [Sulfuricellaceae bacterium]